MTARSSHVSPDSPISDFAVLAHRPRGLAARLHWRAHMNSQPMSTTSSRPNRVLVALAAAWIVLSFAIGGAVSADDGTPESATTSITGATQP